MDGNQELLRTSCSGCIAGVWSEAGIVEVSLYSSHPTKIGRLKAAWLALRGQAPEMLTFCQAADLDRFRAGLLRARARAFGVEK